MKHQEKAGKSRLVFTAAGQIPTYKKVQNWSNEKAEKTLKQLEREDIL